MKTGTEVVKLLLLVVAILIESFCEGTYHQLTVDNNDLKEKKTPLHRRGSTPMCGALDRDKGCCHRKGRGYRYKQ